MTILIPVESQAGWASKIVFKVKRCVSCSITQSCLTLCNPRVCGPPGSSVQGIPQARILEWVAISFSGNFLYPRIEPTSPALGGKSFTIEPPGKPQGEKTHKLKITLGNPLNCP
ncbi:unnamed protein product [Rangifer tarandus platyrhynchus]|uniref:Uncharacterized protein n=2 Tax=Rangifer tarandus platyrhynchus TaxID=3082113 RepID=A0ABN8YA67_RANTA|nr:unnamed protein product [Rangifer tarandus platyrhynchus]